MSANDNNDNRKKSLVPGLILALYVLVILALTVAVVIRFCKIGLSQFGLYTVLINVALIIIGVLCYYAGRKRIREFFTSKEGWAFMLMLIPVLISFRDISGTVTKRFLFIEWNEVFLTNITPSFLSVFFAILFFAAVLLRNDSRRIFTKPIRYIITAVDVLFVSSFLNILCNKEPLPIPGVTISCQSLLMVAVLFSWVGIREAAGFIWAAVLILGVTRLCTIDNVMGFTGAMYLLCAFMSGILQCLMLDVRLSLSNFRQEFAPEMDRIKGDMNAAGSLVAGQTSRPAIPANPPASVPPVSAPSAPAAVPAVEEKDSADGAR